MADYPHVLDFNNTILAVTGQTTDLSVAGRTSKDDGNTQRGEPRNYTLLTAGQYSGTTNITVNAKTDAHTNNVVVDNLKQIMWSRSDSASVGPASDGKLYFDNTATNNEDIFNYCDAANTASLAGHTDWVIPNIFELFSLMVYQGSAPFINSNFTSIASDFYWSSTTRPDNTALGMVASFGVTTISAGAKTSATYYCLLMRKL